MPFVATEVEDKKRIDLVDYYKKFMTGERSTHQTFNSLDEFKKSTEYNDLPEEEKDQFKKYQGKNVIILKFEDTEQALQFIDKAKKDGLLSPKQAEAATSQINEQARSAPRPGM